MRNAISDYDLWYRGGRKTSDNFRARMTQRFVGSRYTATSTSALVERIITSYDNIARNASVAPVTTDQATLNFLGIRAQCVEWQARIAIASGGRGKSYGSAGEVTTRANWRPGMAAFRTDNGHAAILSDVYWDASGQPTSIYVIDANFGPDSGPGWSNPPGETPWARMVRRHTQSVNSYRIVNLDQ
jgi:hypothetical protein